MSWGRLCANENLCSPAETGHEQTLTEYFGGSICRNVENR